MNPHEIPPNQAVVILALVAAKQVGRRPVSYRWLLQHLQPTIRKGYLTSGETPDTERAVSAEARRLVLGLEASGILAVERTGQQIRAVRITMASVGRVFQRQFAGAVLESVRNEAPWGERGEQITELANEIGVSERTIWRWVKQETNPRLEWLAPLIAKVAPDVITDASIVSSGHVLSSFLLEADLTKQEVRRASLWLDRHYLNPQFELLQAIKRIKGERNGKTTRT